MPSFAQLNLNSSLLQTLDHIGHKEATPIQQQAIPRILAGKDVIATAQTGTGKTAAYLLPAFEMLINNPRKKNYPRILVLTPTRELAMQVKDAAMNYGRHLRPEIASILGGMPYNAQLRQLAKPLDIIVATPGRLIDHLDQKRLNLSAIEILIIDEADRMLDMGFIDDIKLIVSSLPKSRQTLLFTATLDKHVTNLANSILNNPERIEVLGKQVTLENIEQRLHIADDISHKSKLLQHILANECIQKAIIFSATKRETDILARQLRDDGHRVGTLHGDMKQAQRNKTILQLRTGKIYLLVATDVAARGIDINDISHVINYDLPKVAEDYVHRIGRTGRAGKSGIAISFASGKDGALLKQIEKFTQHTIKQQNIPGLESKRGLSNDKGKPGQRGRSRSSSSPKKFSAGKSHTSAGRSDNSRDRFNKSFSDHSRFNKSDRSSRFAGSSRDSAFDKSKKPRDSAGSERQSRFDKPERSRNTANSSRDSHFDKSERSRNSARDSYSDRRSTGNAARGSYSDRPDRARSSGYAAREGQSDRLERSRSSTYTARSDRPERSRGSSYAARNDYSDRSERTRSSSYAARDSQSDRSERPRSSTYAARDSRSGRPERTRSSAYAAADSRSDRPRSASYSARDSQFGNSERSRNTDTAPRKFHDKSERFTDSNKRSPSGFANSDGTFRYDNAPKRARFDKSTSKRSGFSQSVKTREFSGDAKLPKIRLAKSDGFSGHVKSTTAVKKKRKEA